MSKGKKRSFFFSSRRRHTRSLCDWSSDVCSSDLDFPIHVDNDANLGALAELREGVGRQLREIGRASCRERVSILVVEVTLKNKLTQKKTCVKNYVQKE